MRFKVAVTKVEVMECWVRANDEDAAIQQVRDALQRPFAYVGAWDTKAAEIAVIETDTAVPKPDLLTESGPALLGLREAGEVLGVPYSAIYRMTRRGDIDYTLIGSKKYISRDTLTAFIQHHTQTGRGES